MVGCLVSHTGEMFGIKYKSNGVITLQLLEGKQCFYDRFLHIASDGRLKAFGTETCLVVDGKEGYTV